MLKPTIACLCLGAAFSADVALARENLAERSFRNTVVKPEQRTHVSVPKRPDFYVRPAALIGDTRDAARRAKELEASMRALLSAAAADAQIELAIVQKTGADSFAVPLTDLETFKSVVSRGARPDSSIARILVKTPVGDKDALDAVDGRLEAFRAAAAMTGRTEFVFQGRAELSLVNPRRYRIDVIRAIASDARQITQAMGEGYAVRVEGLERELGWRRSGDLEMRLFIRHRLEIVPRD